MVKLMCLAFLSTLHTLVLADYCQRNFTVNNLPGGILTEVIAIVTTGMLATFKGCGDRQPGVKDTVKLWYNSRSVLREPILLNPNTLNHIETGKTIKLLVPGWLCNVTNDRMPQLKDAYLERYDANIIRVDWTRYSIDLYSSSFCHVPEVAKYIASFICKLKTMKNVHPSDIHVVGHSMGAQIAGLMGQEVKHQCYATIGRITGLDPAGPLFQFLPKSRRLDATDANFVDVIHTNQNMFGYYGACGDVDFFPNCGTYQPGCLDRGRARGLLNLSFSLVSCNHVRSVEYMIESINTRENKFVGRSCRTCPGVPFVGPCITDFLLPSTAVMGEDCPPHLNALKYHLNTNSEYPFAKP